MRLRTLASGVFLMMAAGWQAEMLAQCCSPLTLGGTQYESQARLGQTINLNWCYLNPLPQNLLYFRLRRSQAPGGNFAVWKRIDIVACTPSTTDSTLSTCHYEFAADRTYWYFLTAVYQETASLKETVGSNQIKVSVNP